MNKKAFGAMNGRVPQRLVIHIVANKASGVGGNRDIEALLQQVVGNLAHGELGFPDLSDISIGCHNWHLLRLPSHFVGAAERCLVHRPLLDCKPRRTAVHSQVDPHHRARP
ncbi:hypothetical protein Mapa_004054 [Marchantia paleacea]|nr:hypothetical protein Mapa_004054 [Marchantia paleacea]